MATRKVKKSPKRAEKLPKRAEKSPEKAEKSPEEKSPERVEKPQIQEEEQFDVKHPLENSWSFWFFTNQNKQNWLENLVELTMFDTVEDYWCLYHHMKVPSELLYGQDYAIFKKGIKPMWEDPANKNGGRWFLGMDKRAGDVNKIWLDLYWVDFKGKLKRRYATIRASRSRTGGGPSDVPELTDIEKKYLIIFGEDYGTGLPGIQVDPFPDSDTTNVLLMIGENFDDCNEFVCGAVVNIRPRSKISLWTRNTEEKTNMVIGKKIKSQLKLNFRLQFYTHESNSVRFNC